MRRKPRAAWRRPGDSSFVDVPAIHDTTWALGEPVQELGPAGALERIRVRRQRLTAAFVALAFTLVWHRLFGDIHFTPVEEGYFWYGVWRAGEGEIPLRDFQSYDPGRYLTSAVLGGLLGGGLPGLRRALALFQAAGLVLALLSARRAFKGSWPLVPLGLALGVWAFPRNKIFEVTLSLASTWAALLLLERPTVRRHLGLGVVVGLAGFFGRNLGLYSGLGALCVLALSAIRRNDRGWKGKALAWCGGVVIGYAPMLALCLFVPGFWAGFLRYFVLLLRIGPNLEYPWPWPWRIEVERLDPRQALELCSFSLVSCLPVIVLPLAWFLVARARAADLPRRALLFSGALMGTFFIHHAAVRSDATHLAQALHPTFLALLGLLAPVGAACGRGRALVLLVFEVLAVLAAAGHNPSFAYLGRPLVHREIGGQDGRMLPEQADYHARVERTLGELLLPEDEIFVAPALPGLYPALGRRSPSWWIYFFVPDPTLAEEQAIVAELRDVEWVLHVSGAIGGREDLRFPVSHPLVWQYIGENYQRVPTPELDARYMLFRRGG